MYQHRYIQTQNTVSRKPDVSFSPYSYILSRSFHKLPTAIYCFFQSVKKLQRKLIMATESKEEAPKTVMVVGIDDSEHSYYALQWTLQHFFTHSNSDTIFKLVIVHAKPTPASVVSLAGPGAADIVPYVESDLRNTAKKVLEKAKEMCISQSVHGVLLEVIEGDARNVLCDAVEKHHADMLVVGSHGYGAIKRTVLGSVSDYCAHHAHCSVMIVKKPKQKQ